MRAGSNGMGRRLTARDTESVRESFRWKQKLSVKSAVSFQDQFGSAQVQTRGNR